MKRTVIGILSFTCILVLFACKSSSSVNSTDPIPTESPNDSTPKLNAISNESFSNPTDNPSNESSNQHSSDGDFKRGDSISTPSRMEANENLTLIQYLNESGDTIATRILPPEGYKRKKGNGYEEFLRNQELLPDGSPVLLYNGQKKGNQDDHVAVLSIDVGDKDLQQCADAALRLRCEYLFSTEQFDKINYHLTNGDSFPYSKYRNGYRLKVNGNQTTLNKVTEYDDGYSAFRKYCDVLFAYAGTLSVEKESVPIKKSKMRIGDVFIQGGSPGHCVIVMDMCENENGDKLFLLGQSYMPAQQIHILKNPDTESPWYSLSELSFPFHTPEWTFQTKCLRRMP